MAKETPVDFKKRAKTIVDVVREIVDSTQVTDGRIDHHAIMYERIRHRLGGMYEDLEEATEELVRNAENVVGATWTINVLALTSMYHRLPFSLRDSPALLHVLPPDYSDLPELI